MLSKLTLVGIHNYTKGAIWDDVLLPDGIDREILINEILKQSGEFCVLYPDADFLKVQISQFFKKWYHNFERWINAYNFDYEALFNLDVKSTITEEGQNYENGSKTINESKTVNGTNSEDISVSSSGNTSATSSGSNENIHQKAAYDSGTFQNVEKDNSTSSLNSSGNNSQNSSTDRDVTTSETSSGTGSEVTSGNSNHKITTEEWRRGNQGVTQSQELLLAEYNAWRFNIYSQIADIFASEFCVTVYF